MAIEAEEDAAGEDFEPFDIDDYDEFSIKKVYDDYTVMFNEDGFDVDFKIKLKLNDNDDISFETYDVTVIFEDGENTEIEADLVN